MKNIIFLSLFSTIVGSLFAQLPCQTDEVMYKWLINNPNLQKSFLEQKLKSYELDKQMAQNHYQTYAAAANIYTIPIVFHILHTGGGENISDAQVQDAVRILNEDFSATNADTASVVYDFKNMIGNTQVRFELAKKDPNGICTNGIVRHYDVNTDWPMVDFSKYLYTWNPNNYLNIYVVRSISGGQAAGYTFLPGSGVPQSADAIVILHNYVGSIGSGNYGLSRALTHEVGHWLDLEHTWGYTNSPGVACGDDGVSDTPITKGFTSCNLGNGNVCAPNVQENIQNYMEYAYCARMFTTGQSFKMQQCLNGLINGRNNLSSNNNLINTGIINPTSGCNTNLFTIASAYTVCAGKPLSVKAFTWNANPNGYSWNATGNAIFNAPNSDNTTVSFGQAGVQTISCTANGPFGPVNETFTVLVLNAIPNFTKANTEPFEFFNLPFNWKTYNLTASAHDWEITGDGKYSGINCIMVPGEKLTPGSIVILESPSYDFLNNPGATYSFWFAYARASTFHNDKFKVQASRDCGGTWTDIWVPAITTVANLTGGTKSGTFTPQPIEWSKYTLSNHPAFIPFLSESNVHIRFVFTEDDNVGFGNRFYLDDVNFSGAVGLVESTLLTNFTIGPNPNFGSFTGYVSVKSPGKAYWKITDLLGKSLLEGTKDLNGGTSALAFEAALPIGIYFIEITFEGRTMQRKLIIQ